MSDTWVLTYLGPSNSHHFKSIYISVRKVICNNLHSIFLFLKGSVLHKRKQLNSKLFSFIFRAF